MEYLINNIDLIIAIIYALAKTSTIAFIVACIVQTAVYRLSNKRISLYNIAEKFLLRGLN